MYAFDVQLDCGYGEAVERVTAALETEGFGVLSEIDVKATLKRKIDLDRKPYIILGACNPHLASRALEADPDIGVLLPCNVVVREEDDGTASVVFMDPAAVMSLVERPGVNELAGEVRQRLKRIAGRLADATTSEDPAGAKLDN